ncbi:NAD(P)-dependent alcohol dehydrogenase [Silvanigrella aquatica]|uniref:Hydroxyacid dehydrogenase n=1 Tax=Silvanigrella aquatica TaxID=1915309 RepID=A0A1L4D185_9BACT|nr:NAD(P)-dependent alcohol dehydrogenase [Silvanigrella aquatica]APJ03956.1 hydroxyacid dehydrogenase [Silvanigrella aquatica]
MSLVEAYAAMKPKEPLRRFQFKNRETGNKDVQIEIMYSGICHSDIHMAREEWGPGMFPLVPGHEIAGKVTKVGAGVTRFKVGDHVGVGCMVDSCRNCNSCKKGIEQYCDNGATFTYGSKRRGTDEPTYGGYSTQIVADEDFVLKIPANLPLDKAAPLLCAGITTYSPLRQWNVKHGDRVAVVGLGGLGHMAVKIAVAMGAEVTVISRSEKKKADSIRLGARHYINTSEPEAFTKNANQFDFILNTVSAELDLSPFLNLLKLDATMVQVGVPDRPNTVSMISLIGRRRRLGGSLIGGIQETQEMLDFCGKHHISSDIELIPAEKINEAYERVVKGDVKFRFVIDIQSLK